MLYKGYIALIMDMELTELTLIQSVLVSFFLVNYIEHRLSLEIAL